MRAHALYTGDIGAIFTEDNGSTWFHHALIPAAQWLSTHNSVIRNKGYALIQPQDQYQPFSTFSTATLVNSTLTSSTSNSVQSLRPSAVVIPPFDLNPEIHDDEHFHYNRLIAGSAQTTAGTQCFIPYADPDLEALIFPHLFLYGRGHYKYYIQNLPRRLFIDTYQKWIKLCLLHHNIIDATYSYITYN